MSFSFKSMHMAMIVASIASLWSFLAPCSGLAGEDGKIYPFESAVLKFDEELSHGVREKIVHIADWGRYEREDLIKSFFGEQSTTTTLYRGDEAYRLDWEDKTYKKITPGERKPMGIGFKELADKLGSEEEASGKLLKSGWYVLPEEPILGYFCECWKEYDGKYVTTFWAYNGIVLKKIVKYRDTDDVEFWMKSQAKKAQFNIFVDEEIFEIPSDFKETDKDIEEETGRAPLTKIRLP